MVGWWFGVCLLLFCYVGLVRFGLVITCVMGAFLCWLFVVLLVA